MVRMPVLTLSLAAREQLNLSELQLPRLWHRLMIPVPAARERRWCVQRSFTRETEACARLSALGHLSSLRRKELVFLPYSLGGGRWGDPCGQCYYAGGRRVGGAQEKGISVTEVGSPRDWSAAPSNGRLCGRRKMHKPVLWEGCILLCFFTYIPSVLDSHLCHYRASSRLLCAAH